MIPQPWIKTRCKELGKTLKGLGQAMGELDGSRITEILAGTRRVQPVEAQAMAIYLELPYEVVSERLYGSVPTIGGDVRSQRPVQWAEPQTLPLYAARDLGGGIVELSIDPAKSVPVPAFSQPIAGAFLCYVATDHMAPAYERGDSVLINPIQPPAPGNDVLLISGGNGEPRKAALRRLLAITETHWNVKYYHPSEKTEKFDRKTWHTAMRVEAVRRR